MYVSMKNMLEKANVENYAVMAINCFNLETIRSVITAAEQENAPIIINLYQEHLLQHCDSELVTPMVKTLAGRSKINVALNFDHGQEIIDLKKAIDDGFSSVMVDASLYSFEENVLMTREIVNYAHPRGVCVEGEIGCIGAVDGENFTSDSMYTNPDQVEEFIKNTGIDVLAISIGSSHGTYPDGMIPDFDFERLKKIKALVKIPLVLHGGSGSGKKNILTCVKHGINKINVGCDFMQANINAARAALSDPVINFFDFIKTVEKESNNIVKQYIRLSGSANKN
ncbi:class II fructose-bisphosphate aldolase [Pectinatus cerevisiiphilus]|uniref:Fructose-bisphosphate aldolase class II n=1 Tax=Pectinatus cerevisiiphilus TaxID=86956 RepID=A0A4R3K5V1_9FIRM|nr:class II fructose-bisphosphate aldolase [Pectinatus cerevisiiphilus]TCS78145.1 fructose-bisphosphate aldolase class II [Pectinatus cerevisiiphilus]